MRRRTTPVGTRLNYWRVRPRRGNHEQHPYVVSVQALTEAFVNAMSEVSKV